MCSYHKRQCIVISRSQHDQILKFFDQHISHHICITNASPQCEWLVIVWIIMTSTEVTSTGVLEESSIYYDLLVFQTMVIFIMNVLD